jgi:hypothetical protein
MIAQEWNKIRPFFSGGDGSSLEQAVRINMLLLPRTFDSTQSLQSSKQLP